MLGARRWLVQRRPRTESGAALVEAAISILVLFMLAFGVMEYGVVFGTTMDLATTAGDGARAGSLTSADGPPTDDKILRALKESSATPSDTMSLVVVYKASGVDGLPPTGCTQGIATTGCNIYRAADFDKSAAQLAASSGSNGWPVASRQPGVDYIGVWVESTHQSITGLVKAPQRISDYAVMRLEGEPPAGSAQPDSFGWSNGTSLEPPWEQNWAVWGGHGYPDRHAGGNGSSGGGSGGNT